MFLDVIPTRHAKHKLRFYGWSEDDIVPLIKRLLIRRLRSGLKLTQRGVIILNISPNVTAVCRCGSYDGRHGWIVKTIIKDDGDWRAEDGKML